jgi:heme oxygenase
MEGSRLGGQSIARHAEKVLALKPGEGTGYFRGFAEHTGKRWNEFLALLREDIPEHQSAHVITGAKAMFAAVREHLQKTTAA